MDNFIVSPAGYLWQSNRDSFSYFELFSIFTWRQGGHVSVQNDSEKSLLGIWFYYYAKRERHFDSVLYTNMALSSRE